METKIAVTKTTTSSVESTTKMGMKNLSVFYGKFRAVAEINLTVQSNKITAIIGPSGCGKSTLLRSFNRMNDLTPSARMDGEILLDTFANASDE